MDDKGLASTGIVGLDDILGGGWPTRRMYLVEGDPGVGKTTLALQFLMAGVQQGERALYVTLSESTEELAAVAASHGWSLDGIEVHEMGPTDEHDHGDDENTLYAPAEVELGERMQALRALIDQIRPRRMVIDSVSELRLLAQTPLRFRRQILMLKQDLFKNDCTMLLLENPLTPTGDVLLQSLVHGVLHLEQLAPEYGPHRRRLKVVKLREVAFRGGFHDFTIRRGTLEVYPRLVASEHVEGPLDGVARTGSPALDALLGGGVDRGTSTLIIGPAGTGKSTVAASIASAAAERGECTVIYTFDEGRETLLTRCDGVGIPLRAQSEAGTVLVEQVNPAALSPGEFVHRVRGQVDAQHAQIVVIDSLNGFLTAMPEERFLVVQLHELLSFLRQRGVAVILTEAQHGLVAQTLTGPVDVSYLADTVLLLRYVETDGVVRKVISVMKKRSGDHERTVRELSMGREGLVVGPPIGGAWGGPLLPDPPTAHAGAPSSEG